MWYAAPHSPSLPSPPSPFPLPWHLGTGASTYQGAAMPTIGQLEPDPRRRVPDGPWCPLLAGEKNPKRAANFSKNDIGRTTGSSGPGQGSAAGGRATRTCSTAAGPLDGPAAAVARPFPCRGEVGAVSVARGGVGPVGWGGERVRRPCASDALTGRGRGGCRRGCCRTLPIAKARGRARAG